MVSELLRKLFGLTPVSCLTCEVLRDQLDKSEGERRDLLARLLEKDKPELPAQQPAEPNVPITPQHIPWRVKQQMLEQEDRQTARLMRDKAREIADLEKELHIGTANASEKREAI